MQFKIFTIPVENSEQYVEEMNSFLRSNKIIDVKKDVVNSGGSCFWSFCITYLPQLVSSVLQVRSQKTKLDYKNILTPEAFYKFYPGEDTSNISIGANMNMSGAGETLIDDVEEPIEYYNLNGVRVQNQDRGVYIKRQGGRATKVVL